MLKASKALCEKFKVAVVGSGPAGFYTAYRLMSKLPETEVDMFESLPVPYGLSRFGVAPDHPEVKNCQEKFEEVASSRAFRFVGNVTVGKDLSLRQLKDNYNALVLAYGASQDRTLGIEGEKLGGVFSARKFVGWYNGLPEFAGMNPPLQDAEDVAIIGNGNVALDVARILLADVERLKSTDITEEAYELLKNSRVKRVRMYARRGILQSAFTTKEMRELVREPGVRIEPLDPRFLDPFRDFIPQLDRKIKRVVQLLDNANHENEKKQGPLTKSFSLEYLMSPTAFHQSNSKSHLLSAINFEMNTLRQESITSPAIALPSGRLVTEKADLAFKSIGYKSVPIAGMKEIGIPFDDKRGVVPSTNGRVLGLDNRPMRGCYVSGWVKTGPTGVIAESMRESFEVAEEIVKDFSKNEIDKSLKPGYDGVSRSINSRPVTWSDWLKIERVEKERGASLGKPRSKITSTSEMLSLL